MVYLLFILILNIPSGNHTLAVVKMPESYELLSATLRPVLDDLEHLMAAKSINIDGTDYALQFFLGGDLKVYVMLSILIYCCIKCNSFFL